MEYNKELYFGFDNTGILHALFTIILCVIGSILTAKVMDISHCSYIFARRTILRYLFKQKMVGLSFGILISYKKCKL